MLQLSIIIVNYNVKYFLEQCLFAVQAGIKSIEAEVIVVDNNSTDNSLGYLQPFFPSVQFVSNPVNEGYGKANNIALKMARGKYVLFLNPDTIIGEQVLAGCVRFLETNKQAGAIGVKLLDGSGSFLPESKRSLPSPRASFFKLSGMAALFPKSSLFNEYALGHLHENRNAEVDVLVGAFMMVNREILLRLNGFDEDFFMYGEDIDLSYRIKKAGYQNYYLGTLSIVHFKGESAYGNEKYLHYFYEAMRIFVDKHYGQMPLQGFLLKRAITTGGAAAKLKAVLKKKVVSPPSVPIILFGREQKDCLSAAKILQRNHKEFKITNNLSLENGSSMNEVIFCTGTLTYEETFQLIENNPQSGYYKWHASGSASIVGSSHKQLAGDVMY